jgi:curved DNA-binding protein CbpA
VRIPLDYYRILGTPLPTSDEQVSCAYQDRSEQLPRREYSDLAIAGRKQLLDQAYRLLSTEEKRAAYAAEFLSPEPADKGIEILPEQLPGALLLLLELGEYTLVEELGQAYLEDAATTENNDITLSIALARLELSREEWQQKAYEKAATIAGASLALVEGKPLWEGVQEEIRTDFYKLRPYRILELLGSDLSNGEARNRGLKFLKEMLAERQGIEGKGNDRSGLNLDNFLRFIQQLRTQLTVEEQLTLFRLEAQRPSWAATYLKVYALIARGFAHNQPYFIEEAQETLTRLSKRQDVHLEMAICSLLLGQTDQATQLLSKSLETEALEYIKRHGEEPEQLLVGLCRYGEKWLQTEVFCYFRDLLNAKADLKVYFADTQVQTYLEPLTNERETVTLDYTPAPSLLAPGGTPTMREYQPSSLQFVASSSRSSYPERVTMSTFSPKHKNSTLSTPNYHTQGNLVLAPRYVENPRRVKLTQSAPLPLTTPEAIKIPVTPPKKTRRKRYKFPARAKFILSAFALGTVGLGFLSLQAFQSLRSPLAALSGEQLEIFLEQPPLEIPVADALPLPPTSSGSLSTEQAQSLLEGWLSVKAQALGKDHKISYLSTVLTEPMLDTWKQRAQALGGKDYWQYQHQVQVESVTIDPQNPNLATVEARVQEKANYFSQGQLNRTRSFDERLQVRYQLSRVNNKWLIKNSQVF